MERVRAAWRWYRRSPARDVLFALGLTALTVYGSYGEGHPRKEADVVQFHGLPIPQPGPAALALVAVTSMTLAFRNRWPYAVLAASTAGVLAFTLLGYVNGAALLAPAAGVYTVATRVTARRALAATAVALSVLLVATAARSPFGSLVTGPTDVLPVLFAAICLGGIAVSNRRAYVASIHARAEEDARRRVDEERLRIARELHDVVAHTMATINVQANAAAAVLADKPDVAAESLQAIRNASRDGLRELRSILNILRQADDTDSTTPAPGLDQVGSLVDHAVRAGLPTTLEVAGEAITLPPSTDLAAYRIIQESLTNAIRHAGPATAAVSLTYSADGLRIEVADTGRGMPNGMAGSSGHGIVGMRERAAAAGGFLTAGPRSGGGFQVTARLPVRTPDAAAAPDAAAEPEGARP
jgi:signal transduction histidine kinase